MKTANEEADEITVKDRQLFHKAHCGLFPAFFPRDWANLRDQAESQIVKDYFHEKYLQASLPSATLPEERRVR